MENIYLDIALVILIATIGGFIAVFFKQPLIPLYILAGLLLGPIFGVITNKEIISTLSQIGIAFLLFVIGLEIDLKKLRETISISVIGGIIQTLLISLITYLIAYHMGFSSLESLYWSLIVSFSSTMIVLKILSDRKEIETLHARIIIGFLLLQDIIAILALSILTSINNFSLYNLGATMLESILSIVVAAIAAAYIFPQIFKVAARLPELLMLTSLSILFIFSLLFNYIGLTIAVGAFIAGLSLANLPYSKEIVGRIRSLRDFFSTIFFVSLGLNVIKGSISGMIETIIIFSLIVIFIKPLTIFLTNAAYGYKRRTSFLTGISLAQISEFSLIIVAVGNQLGHIPTSMVTATSIIAMITITFSTYLITFNRYLLKTLSPFLKFFERTNTKEELHHLPPKEELKNHIIIFGCDRVGRHILETLKKLKKQILVVDYNPEVIKIMRKNKIHSIYGDMGDIELLKSIGLDKAQTVISTVPNLQDNLLILELVNKRNQKSLTYTTAQTVDEALELYRAGSDYVILPHLLGGERVALLLEEIENNLDALISIKNEHIRQLKEQKHEFEKVIK